MMSAIVTMPPYAPFVEEVAGHPFVSGLRLNTVMPVKHSLEEVLQDLLGKSEGKDLWIDLKCRQLRVKGYWVPPFTEIEVSNKLTVNTPVKAYFGDGRERATVVEVDGNKLIMLDGPRRVVGPGESINIVDPSLKIEGYLTDTDKAYLKAGAAVGISHYMLSFVEQAADIEEARLLCPNAEFVAKIESQKGIHYTQNEWNREARLMAARGDLYIEVKKPHEIVKACEDIVTLDEEAIVASRILPSVAESPEPSCTDLGDIDSLMRMGYKTFMLGDEVCMKRASVITALNILEAMAEQYQKSV